MSSEQPQKKLSIQKWKLSDGDPAQGIPALFLGRDEATYGTDGTGWVAYEPEYECGGEYGKTALDYQCPFLLTQDETLNKTDAGSNEVGKEERLLHVMVASHRDPLCPRTLYDFFTKAAYPELLRVNVLQQNDPEIDPDCLEGYCELIRTMGKENHSVRNSFDEESECPHRDQVHIHSIHAKDAKGPTFARGMLSADMEKFYNEDKLSPQDHCMSTDSHMQTKVHWDKSMVDMWNRASNEYAVLSSYVNDIEKMKDKNLKGEEVPHLCMVTFTSNVRTHATKCARNLPKPKLTTIWGAGLSFSKCHADLKAQVDPHTPHIFDGEEFNRAARYFTNGYDIYTPDHSFVYHNYHESQSNPVMHSWHNSFSMSEKQYSEYRLKTMIDVPGGEKDADKALVLKRSKFGLGDRRSLDQLIQFTGIDLRNAKPSLDGKNRCGNLRWVPFKQHVKGVNYIPKFDSDENPLDEIDETSIWFDILNPEEAGKQAFMKEIQEAQERLTPDLPAENVLHDKEESSKDVKIPDNPYKDMKKEDHVEHQDSQLIHLEQNISKRDEQHNSLQDQKQGFIHNIPDHVISKITNSVLGDMKSKSIMRAPPINKFQKNLRASNNLPRSTSAGEHGFSHLPLHVRVGAVLLTICLGLTIIFNATIGKRTRARMIIKFKK